MKSRCSARPATGGIADGAYCDHSDPNADANYCIGGGTCAWDTAEGYFRDAAMLWQRFERPDLIGLSYDAELVPSDVRRAFARVNEGLPEQAVGIQINARGWLEEVFICLDLDYRPRPCAPAEYGPADSLQEGISIWRGGKTGN